MQGRTVSVLFCDIVDSTPLGQQLDPEALQRVMSRWFAEARTIIERHGGTIEKFTGDEFCRFVQAAAAAAESGVSALTP